MMRRRATTGDLPVHRQQQIPKRTQGASQSALYPPSALPSNSPVPLQMPKEMTVSGTRINSPTIIGDARGNMFIFHNNKDSPDQPQLGNTEGEEKAQLSHSQDGCKKLMAKAIRWEGKTKLKTFGPQKKKFSLVDDVAPFSNNEIVVLDRDYKQLITFLPRSKDMPLSQELRLGLANPSHVSVTNDDHLVVLDYPKVKIFNRSYQPCLCQFQPECRGGMQSIPSCLAVDDKNQIAMGYEKEEKISLHNLNGCLIKELSAPKIGEHLSIHRQQFVYITRDKKKLQAVDIKGNVIFSSDIHGDLFNSQAHGLCHDSEGGIYVAVRPGRLQEGVIQLYSPDGTYTECVRRVCDYPAGITFTPAGDLVIAGESIVELYH